MISQLRISRFTCSEQHKHNSISHLCETEVFQCVKVLWRPYTPCLFHPQAVCCIGFSRNAQTDCNPLMAAQSLSGTTKLLLVLFNYIKADDHSAPRSLNVHPANVSKILFWRSQKFYCKVWLPGSIYLRLHSIWNLRCTSVWGAFPSKCCIYTISYHMDPFSVQLPVWTLQCSGWATPRLSRCDPRLRSGGCGSSRRPSRSPWTRPTTTRTSSTNSTWTWTPTPWPSAPTASLPSPSAITTPQTKVSLRFWTNLCPLI